MKIDVDAEGVKQVLLDYAEIEAELNENAGENSGYRFNAPVFY